MPTTLSFGDLTIEGCSRAGEETWFRIHPPGLAFDVGRGAPQLAGAGDLFLSHGHLDHALGLPYVLSLQTLHGLRPTRIHCPSDLVGDLFKLLQAAAELEAVDYRFEINGLNPGGRIAVGKDLSVEAFATDHVVPSLGYHLLRCKRRLSAEFRGRSADQLVRLRQQGVEIERSEEEIWLSYCGDTSPRVFELEPRLYASSVLLLECTFFDTASRQRGQHFKHIHLQDLGERAKSFRNRELVLHHPSRRYGREQMHRLIERHLAGVEPRVHLFGAEVTSTGESGRSRSGSPES